MGKNPANGQLESGFDPLAPYDPQYLIVNGSGFGTKSANSPAIAEYFTGAANGQLLSSYSPSWVAYADDGGVITNLNPRYSGHKSGYNDYTRGEFSTNYKQYDPSRSVFLSYWARICDFRSGYDGGVIKHGRITSSSAAGGGGVYNEEGSQAFGGVDYGTGGYPSWSGSENGLNSLGEFSDLPLDAWFRIEYEVHLNDVDVANGFYNLRGDVFSGRQSGAIMQRKTGFTKANYLLDTTLLGLEIANPKKWYKPVVFTALTTYTVTVDGIPCSWTSGASAPTANDICTNLRLAVIATGGVNPSYTTVYQDELYIDYGKSSVYDAKFAVGHKVSLQVGDVYLDTSLSRFVIGNAATYAACTIKEPQPYYSWNNTQVKLTKKLMAFSGQKYLYFVNATLAGTTSVFLGEITNQTEINVGAV
jgi:hypothetical protein